MMCGPLLWCPTPIYILTKVGKNKKKKLELDLFGFQLYLTLTYGNKFKSKPFFGQKNKKKLVYTTSDDEANIEESLKIKLKPYIVL